MKDLFQSRERQEIVDTMKDFLKEEQLNLCSRPRNEVARAIRSLKDKADVLGTKAKMEAKRYNRLTRIRRQTLSLLDNYQKEKKTRATEFYSYGF